MNLTNNMEFYSSLKSNGYLDSLKRVESYRQQAETESAKTTNKNIVFNRSISENVGTGVESSLKSSGAYVDLVTPQYSSQSPVSRSPESFKSVLQVLLNRPGYNTSVAAKTYLRKYDSSEKADTVSKTLNLEDNGYVITVPGDKAEKMSSREEMPIKDKLYNVYTNNFNYTGGLVNVSV
ncbi:MAG: hypothetical protein WCJ01_00900 [Ignavibacteria bacterium]